MGTQSGKSGTKDIATRYPVEEGLTAGTTKQTGEKRLVAEKSFLKSGEKKLI